MSHEGRARDDIADEDVQTIWGLSWLAVRSDDPTAVAAALGLAETRERSARAGFEETARGEGACFVAPSIDGFTLVVALDVAFDGPLLARCSRTFGEAQAFHADPKRNGYVWRRSRGGETVRSVEVTPDEVTTTGEGAPPEPSPLAPWPDTDEYDVLRIARAWSVDPNRVLSHDGRGRIGIRPGAALRWSRTRKKPNWKAGALFLVAFLALMALIKLVLVVATAGGR